MAAKKSTGIKPATVNLGGGISAVRALPKAKGKRPAVIILHERYGIDQHTKDLTVKLAQAGFVGLAPDLFHRFTGDRNAVLRGEQRVDLTDDGALADLNAAVEYLKKLPSVDPSRLGIIGVCQSGRQALLLPANRNDIAGAVVLYGAFGEADHIISIDDVVRFRNCFEKAKKSYHIRLYRDAPHGWLNDTMPGRYRKEAANYAWKLMMAFLKKCFAGRWDRERIACTFESDYSTKYDFSKNVRME